MAAVTIIPMLKDSQLVIITINGEEFKLLLEYRQGNFYKSPVYCSPNVETLLAKDCCNLLLNRLSRCHTLEEGIDEFLEVLMVAISNRDISNIKAGGQAVIDELLSSSLENTIGWKRVKHISKDQRCVILSIPMDGGEVQVKTTKDGQNFVVNCADYEYLSFEREMVNWQVVFNELEMRITQLCAAIERIRMIQTFFPNLLPPSNFALSLTIIIDRGLTIKVSYDKDNLWEGTPQCEVLTSLSQYDEQADSLHEQTISWIKNPTNKPNPKCPKVKDLECQICNSIWINESPATILCTHCDCIFHEECYRVWTGLDPASRRVFTRISSSCPACENVMIE